ncbi:MAG: SCP-like extracellular [Desulfurivibrio sp.]|nr:SCP-like extracellular [Desulfurivibrio sp.]
MQQQPTITRCRNQAVSSVASASLLVLLCLVSASPSSAQDNKVDAMCMVQEHNILRSAVSAPELRWSDALARRATAWADKLKKAGCDMQHSRGKLGENLYWASPLKTTNKSKGSTTWKSRLTLQPIKEKDVVASWATEKPWYSHLTNTCNAPPGKSCGHYTQIVWQNTKEVGCAKAVCDDNSQVWVCNYGPAGNVVGQKPY